jgi:N-methylhydantoinase A
VNKIAQAVADAARAHDFGPDVPVVAVGGAGAALAPEVARRLGRACVRPDHPEILSSVGAALSLIRVEVARQNAEPETTLSLVHEAERACVAAGAAPHTVRVETAFAASEGIVRAVATGAVALEAGVAGRDPVDETAQRTAAADALGLDKRRLAIVARNDFYRVFSENGSGRVAVVDGLGSVALAEHARHVIAGAPDAVLERLRRAVDEASTNLGIATLLPRVALVCGARIVDLSESRRAEEILSAARGVLAEHDGEAVALVWS